MIHRLRRFVLTGGALLLPLFMSAHNGEVLLARIEPRPDGTVSLRVTADLDANFNIQSPEQMAAAAPKFFDLSDGKDTQALSKLVPDVALADEDKLDPAAPLGHTPEELARKYRLQTAEWTWTPESRSFVLRVPDDSPHTFLLWIADPKQPAAKTRWVMLIGGDESPLITVKGPPKAGFWDYVLYTAVALALGLPVIGSVALYFKNRSYLARKAAWEKANPS